MPFNFEYDALPDESLNTTISRVLGDHVVIQPTLQATLLATKKQNSDWLSAANAALTWVAAPEEYKSNPFFMMGIGAIVVACLSPLQLNLISDEAAELLTIIETNARHRSINFRVMQKLLGVGEARTAIKALEKAGYIRQESNGDWVLQRIRLASFKVLS